MSYPVMGSLGGLPRLLSSIPRGGDGAWVVTTAFFQFAPVGCVSLWVELLTLLFT